MLETCETFSFDPVESARPIAAPLGGSGMPPAKHARPKLETADKTAKSSGKAASAGKGKTTPRKDVAVSKGSKNTTPKGSEEVSPKSGAAFASNGASSAEIEALREQLAAAEARAVAAEAASEALPPVPEEASGEDSTDDAVALQARAEAAEALAAETGAKLTSELARTQQLQARLDAQSAEMAQMRQALEAAQQQLKEVQQQLQASEQQREAAPAAPAATTAQGAASATAAPSGLSSAIGDGISPCGSSECHARGALRAACSEPPTRARHPGERPYAVTIELDPLLSDAAAFEALQVRVVTVS